MATSKLTGNIKKRRPRRKRLYLYLINDDINEFDYVHKVLMSVLGHNTYQAEQCAMITHSAGKCLVYEGLGQEPYFMYEIFTKSGLTVKLTHKKL